MTEILTSASFPQLNDPRLPARFWSKVSANAQTGCWEWMAARSTKGYGFFSIGHSLRRSHRVAYETLCGPIPSGLQIDHVCRVRNCCNPAHLEAVTQVENTRRGVAGANRRAKTHCHMGHEYTEVNTRRHNGKRSCRACGRINKARSLAKLRARAA